MMPTVWQNYWKMEVPRTAMEKTTVGLVGAGREVTVRRAKFESQVQMPGGG